MRDLISKSGMMQAIRTEKCRAIDGIIYIPEDELNIACSKAFIYDDEDSEWITKLKACPGCHSEARLIREVFEDGDVWFRPECSQCKIGFQENFSTVKEAVEEWNTCCWP